MRRRSFHAYVINLPSARERMRKMEERLNAARIPYTRIEAVDGRALDLPIPEFDEIGHRLMTGRRPILPEIGCYLSHLRAIDAFLASDASHALILEDDAHFEPSFRHTVQRAIGLARFWDVLRLSSVNSDRTVPAFRLDEQSWLGVSFTRSKGAAAYLLNRRAATKFSRLLRPMRLAYDIAFDLEFVAGLKALAVTPFPVVSDERDVTQIQINIRKHKLPAWRYLTVFPFRAVVETVRVPLRMRLYASTLIRAVFPRRRPAARPALQAFGGSG